MKYSKEVISLCTEILKHPKGCDTTICYYCLIKKECLSNYYYLIKKECISNRNGNRNALSKESKIVAAKIIKEILE